MYFVAGSSPRKAEKLAQRAAALPVSGESTAPPIGPAPSLQLSATDATDARAARAAQIAVVLDDIDATLHSIRLTWPGKMGTFAWSAPGWLTAERLDRELAALDSQLVGASDTVSLRTREWIAVARPDGARLLALNAAWAAPGASADEITAELRPIFDRLVAASQAVHAAVAADLRPLPSGTLSALAAACRIAPLLARMPVRGAAAEAPIAEQGGRPPSSAPLPEPRPAELRELATACSDESRAYLVRNPDDQLDYHDIYQLSLASQMTINLLSEMDRRRKPPDRDTFISATGNLAQESSYLATSRRQYDPSLLPAEAEAPLSTDRE